MKKALRAGDRVSWNSEAGRVSGTVIRIHTKNVGYKGYTHHATPEEPQYEIRSSRSDHVAMHKRAALRKLPGVHPRRGG
jgi:hypothetical protein